LSTTNKEKFFLAFFKASGRDWKWKGPWTSHYHHCQRRTARSL
jgi:hypothetical protein